MREREAERQTFEQGPASGPNSRGQGPEPGSRVRAILRIRRLGTTGTKGTLVRRIIFELHLW